MKSTRIPKRRVSASYKGTERFWTQSSSCCQILKSKCLQWLQDRRSNENKSVLRLYQPVQVMWSQNYSTKRYVRTYIVTFLRSFYPSTSSTTSVRADFSILGEIHASHYVCGHKATRHRDTTLPRLVVGLVPCYPLSLPSPSYFRPPQFTFYSCLPPSPQHVVGRVFCHSFPVTKKKKKMLLLWGLGRRYLQPNGVRPYQVWKWRRRKNMDGSLVVSSNLTSTIG